MNQIPPRLAEALTGRYTLLRPIGEGGMATVYLADDLRHERQVALKVLKPELAAVVGGDRFLSEIKTTAGLQHPNILPLFDSGQADSFLYYVMPYIEGETLRDRIDREHQLPVDDAVSIARAVASALQVAHDRGIVHRDIKPGNILMSRGKPLVADFGIALAVGTAGGSRLTETGLSVGTPYYMSPEQATGDREVGPASDIYALAAVLYEMLVGEPPYPGTTAQAVLGKIIQGEPVSAREGRSTVPPNVDGAVRRALEKLPADRFTRAEDFERALADPGFRYGEEAEAVPPASAGLWKAGTGVGLGVSAILAGALLMGALAPEPPEPVEFFSLRQVEGQARDHNFDIADDGSRYAFVVNEEGVGEIRFRRLGALEAVPVPGTQGATFPALSPDGTRMAFVQGGQVKSTPLTGGVIQTLADSVFCCLSWEDDGHVYFNASTRYVHRVPENGGPVEAVTPRLESASAVQGGITLHPDGGVGVFSVFTSPAQLEAIDLETRETNVIAQGSRAFFTPDGDLLIATEAGDLLAARFDPATLDIVGTPVPIFEGIQVPSTSYANLAFAALGDLLYWRGAATSGSQTRVVRVDRKGVATPIDPDWIVDAGPSNERALSLSPDGRYIAVKHVTDAGEDIWIKQLDDGPFSRLTFDPEGDWRPWWSPDGRWVYFISWRNGQLDLYRRRSDGTGQAELVLDAERHVAESMLSPEGDGLVIRLGGSVGGINNRDIAFYSFADSTISPLIDESYDEKEATLSPDGRWLAYSSTETGRDEIYIRPYPDVGGGKWQISTGGGQNPRWSPRGGEIFFIDAAGVMQAAALRLGDGVEVIETAALFNANDLGLSFAGNYAGYSVDVDGQSVIMMQSVDASGGDVIAEFVLVRNLLSQVRERLGRR